MSPAINLKETIIEALNSLGGSGTTSDVRKYINSKYGKDWPDIGNIMADLCTDSKSSFFFPSDKVLKQIGKETFCIEGLAVTDLPMQKQAVKKGNFYHPPKKKISSFSKAETNLSKISSLVDYQEGSVVSKTLLNKEGGSVTLFAFDMGQGLNEHTTPYEALVQIVDGEAVITISGKVYNAKMGEIIIMPADEPHSLKANTRFKMLLTMIK